MVSGYPAGAWKTDTSKKGSVRMLRSLVFAWVWVLQTSRAARVSPEEQCTGVMCTKGRESTRASNTTPLTVLDMIIKSKSPVKEMST